MGRGLGLHEFFCIIRDFFVSDSNKKPQNSKNDTETTVQPVLQISESELPSNNEMDLTFLIVIIILSIIFNISFIYYNTNIHQTIHNEYKKGCLGQESARLGDAFSNSPGEPNKVSYYSRVVITINFHIHTL